MFSPSWSDRTFFGRPCASIADRKPAKTVLDLLLLLHLRKVISRDYPSIPP